MDKFFPEFDTKKHTFSRWNWRFLMARLFGKRCDVRGGGTVYLFRKRFYYCG
jgi:hypothetical protein